MRAKNISPGQDAHHAGITALQRLLDIAHRNSGQPRIVARFLLSLHSGDRFPFDLSDFRCLDSGIFEDCVVVLRYHSQWLQSVHGHVEEGEEVFERLAQRWGFTDHQDASWR